MEHVPGNHREAVNATAMRYARGSWEAPAEQVAHVRTVAPSSVFEEPEALEGVQQQDAEEDIVDLPRPQRAPRARGRPARGQQ